MADVQRYNHNYQIILHYIKPDATEVQYSYSIISNLRIAKLWANEFITKEIRKCLAQDYAVTTSVLKRVTVVTIDWDKPSKLVYETSH